MNIGFVGNVPPPVGGAEVFLQGFLSRFVKPGRNTGTLVRWARQNIRSTEAQRYAPIGHRDRQGALTTYYVFDSLAKPPRNADRVKRMEDFYRDQGGQAAQAFRRHRVRLIHAHSLGNLPFAAYAAKELSLPLVVTVHGMLEFKILDRLHDWSPQVAGLVTDLLCGSKLVLAVSSEIEQYCRHLGVQRVEKLSCGVDTAFFRPPAAKVTNARDILFVGSVRDDKGAPLLIDAFERLNGDLDGKLIFVGKRYINGESVAKARRNPQIRFRGQTDASGVRSALNKARMVVLPSESEGLPLSILEAMACQRPVLVSNTGELGSLIDDGRNGFLIKRRTVAGLARQIKEVVKRSDLDAIGERARRTALGFDLNRVVDCHEEIYRSILGAI